MTEAEPYRILRSARRTVALELREDGTLLIRVPQRMTAQEIAAFVAARTGWIAAARARLANRAAVRDDAADLADLRARAEAELPPRLYAWAARMGLEPRTVIISNAKKRLGSCASDGTIRLSAELLRWPDEVVEYVIVHELAHLRQMNHSAAFYAEVERRLPDYRRALAILRGRTS